MDNIHVKPIMNELCVYRVSSIYCLNMIFESTFKRRDMETC